MMTGETEDSSVLTDTDYAERVSSSPFVHLSVNLQKFPTYHIASWLMAAHLHQDLLYQLSHVPCPHKHSPVMFSSCDTSCEHWQALCILWTSLMHVSMYTICLAATQMRWTSFGIHSLPSVSPQLQCTSSNNCRNIMHTCCNTA